jgi:hypothetical protein
MNDVSVKKAKHQGTRISAKRRVSTTRRNSGIGIRAQSLLLHLIFAPQKLGACEV